ncbi:MAG: LysR family transcriptional regulator [Cyanobacteria bacterium P01_G01_bin.38]
MEDLNQLVPFVRVVTDGNFTQAARKLGMTPSGVSRTISRLEAELGVQLLTRTTRRLSLTHEGEIFYRRCVQILQDVEEAELSVTQSQSVPQGNLSIGIPVAFGQAVLLPVMAEFSKRYPLISTSLFFSDRMVDTIDEGFDIVIRIGNLEDSRLIARPIATTELITCVSKQYLDMEGSPTRVEELRNHNCLGYINQKTGKIMDWYFAISNDTSTIQPSGRIHSTDGNALVDFALANIGIVQLHSYLVEEEIAQGNLIELFPGYRVVSSPISIVYPRKRYESFAVRAFMNFFVERLKEATAPIANLT